MSPMPFGAPEFPRVLADHIEALERKSPMPFGAPEFPRKEAVAWTFGKEEQSPMPFGAPEFPRKDVQLDKYEFAKVVTNAFRRA